MFVAFFPLSTRKSIWYTMYFPILSLLVLTLTSTTHVDAWLPASGKIRGVNLGSLFIIEPWMAADEWRAMGCGGTASEFDCVRMLGQTQANRTFANHWNTWITLADVVQMKNYGLNTVRIPVGYWMMDGLTYASEYFPQGGFHYLERLCSWLSDAGFYIIIDLHGAPGSQVVGSAFTGQITSTAGFYVWWQFNRAFTFLRWMVQTIHTNNNFRNVGMLEVVNEPVHAYANPTQAQSLREVYYPGAWSTIRGVENSLNIGPYSRLHIQMMNKKWGSGDPHEYLTDDWFAAYDDHRYFKWDGSVPVDQSTYISTACKDDRGGDLPVIVGEWSLAVPDSVENSLGVWNIGDSGNAAFYTNWWAAQVTDYEKYEGWIFWSWKCNWINGVNDWRWCYQAAVEAGVIPADPAQAHNLGVCK